MIPSSPKRHDCEIEASPEVSLGGSQCSHDRSVVYYLSELPIEILSIVELKTQAVLVPVVGEGIRFLFLMGTQYKESAGCNSHKTRLFSNRGSHSYFKVNLKLFLLSRFQMHVFYILS